MIGSPLKKARPSISEGAGKALGGGNASFTPGLGDILAKAEAARAAANQSQSSSAPAAVNNNTPTTVMEEEEL